MNFVVAISVTYSYILSIGLQDKIGILVNQVFKVEREIPEKQTKSKTFTYCLFGEPARLRSCIDLKVGSCVSSSNSN